MLVTNLFNIPLLIHLSFISLNLILFHKILLYFEGIFQPQLILYCLDTLNDDLLRRLVIITQQTQFYPCTTRVAKTETTVTVCGKEGPAARAFMYIRKGLRGDTDKKIDDYLFFNL